MNDRKMTLTWKKSGPANWYALTRDGGRYTVDRYPDSWAANYLPTGNARGGRVKVGSFDARNLAIQACLACAEMKAV